MSAKKLLTYFFLFVFFGICLGIKLYLVYFGYNFYHYLVPPGYDAIPHLAMIKSLSNQSVWANFIGYPKLFHYLIFYLSQIFHQDSFSILTYWTPVLIIFPAIALYFLLKQIFNLKTAVIASLFFLFTSNYPLYGFVDGNYPNILAYGFFAIFCLAFIIKYSKTKKLFQLYAAIFFYILTGLTHHFSFAELNGILFLSLMAMIFTRQLKLPKPKYNVHYFFVFLLSLFLLFSLLFAYKLYGTQFTSFFIGLISNKSVIQDAYLNQAVQYHRYPEIIGPLIWYGGILGFFYMLITFLKSQEKDYTKMIIFVWVILIYLLSRLPASGLPERFARELAIPITICFAYLIDRIINHPADMRLNRLSVLAGYGLMIYLIIINSSLYNPVMLDSLPDSFSKMVWYTQADQEKSDYLKNNFSADEAIYINLYANPYMQLMTKANLVNFPLSGVSMDIYNKMKKNKQEKQDELNYNNTINSLIKDNRGKLFFISPKPKGNTDGAVYPIFGQFEVYDNIMKDLTRNQPIIKKFADGSRLYRIEQ